MGWPEYIVIVLLVVAFVMAGATLAKLAKKRK